MARIGFVGPAYALDTIDAAAQRCVNWYLVPLEENNEPTKVMLRGTPGLKNWVTVSADQPVRGVINTGSLLLVVCGSAVYTVTTAGVVSSSLGTIQTSQGTVSMATNGQQVLIVDGVSAYIYSISGGTLTTITDPDFPYGATNCGFLDGYFIVNDPGTQYFYVSDSYDGTAWNALDFGAAEGQPDNLVTLACLNGQLWLFGESTSEVHYNSGNADFPFARVPGAVLQRGAAAKHSPAVGNGTVYWFGSDRCVYRSNGYSPQKVSTLAMDQHYAKFTAVSDAFGFVYQQEGHEFYVLTFPTELETWVYDSTTGRWHERGTWNSTLDDFVQWRGSCAATFNDTLVVGDFENGNLYALDVDTVTDNGSNIVRLRRTPHASNAMLRMFHSNVTVVIATGVNGESSPTDEPQAMLRWSNDGGHTWGNELWRSLGRRGQYGRRVQWNRLGMARNRVYELRIADAIRPSIMDDSLEVQGGAS